MPHVYILLEVAKPLCQCVNRIVVGSSRELGELLEPLLEPLRTFGKIDVAREHGRFDRRCSRFFAAFGLNRTHARDQAAHDLDHRGAVRLVLDANPIRLREALSLFDQRIARLSERHSIPLRPEHESIRTAPSDRQSADPIAVLFLFEGAVPRADHLVETLFADRQEKRRITVRTVRPRFHLTGVAPEPPGRTLEVTAFGGRWALLMLAGIAVLTKRAEFTALTVFALQHPQWEAHRIEKFTLDRPRVSGVAVRVIRLELLRKANVMNVAPDREHVACRVIRMHTLHDHRARALLERVHAI